MDERKILKHGFMVYLARKRAYERTSPHETRMGTNRPLLRQVAKYHIPATQGSQSLTQTSSQPRGVTTMLGIRKFLPGNSTCGAAPAAPQVPPLGGDATSAEERPFIQRKGLGCRGDAAPKAEIPLLQRKGRATLGNKELCRLLTEDVVPPQERRHCAAPGKKTCRPSWEIFPAHFLGGGYAPVSAETYPHG